jgi:hypothetical protein
MATEAMSLGEKLERLIEILEHFRLKGEHAPLAQALIAPASACRPR